MGEHIIKNGIYCSFKGWKYNPLEFIGLIKELNHSIGNTQHSLLPQFPVSQIINHFPELPVKPGIIPLTLIGL
ncbi:hypothetical protein [Fusobacterium vincentii ATCC 49256]|uniref:Uncharacterized protein n=1 Tax=Fusobacterium vincentii ATCC 49256 TaxID=209882 RepID=Q7P3H7_FUSVC|nr:hypothetical protein [Fusobacterium vincentii ATCC 49256]